jgi:hypothetical protein
MNRRMFAIHRALAGAALLLSPADMPKAKAF